MIRILSSRLQTLFVLVGLVILFGIASPHFFSTDNLLNVMQQSAINAILGIGLTFVIISGGIDLSVGSILALSGLVVADLLVAGHSIVVAVAAGLLVGFGCGLANGLITTLGRIPPFISTLGMMLMARSAAKIYSGSKPISGLPDSFRALSGDIAGVPVMVLVVAALYVVAHLVLTRTKLGRYTYAIGGNEQAAWLSGVPVGRYKVAIYALSGLMAGAAAVLMTSRLNAASPLSGEMYELYAIAAAVIGGVSLMGGEGRVLGTMIGALIMGTLRNGLNALNVPSALEGMVVGGVLVAAVVLDRARHRGRGGPPAEGWRRYRKWLIVGVGFALSWSLRPSTSGRPRRVPTEERILTVAFVPKALNSPFWAAMEAAALEEANASGVRLVSLAADRETDVERQYQIIENLIQQGVDAILLAPSGSKELVPAIRKANDAGIPVLLIDTRIDEAAAAAVGARGPHLYRIGQLRGRRGCRPLSRRGPRRVGQRGHHRGDLGARDRGPAAAGIPAGDRGPPRHPGCRQPDRQLGARPGLRCGGEHPPGPPRAGCDFRRQRRDGARRAGGDRGRPTPRRDVGDRVRRDPRCAREHPRRDAWRVRWPSSPARWAVSGSFTQWLLCDRVVDHRPRFSPGSNSSTSRISRNSKTRRQPQTEATEPP